MSKKFAFLVIAFSLGIMTACITMLAAAKAPPALHMTGT
jgi:hypothetical protein